MKINELIEYSSKKHKAYIDYPFGDIPICFKINKKLFAQIYPNENDYKITLKCEPLLAELYRQQFPDDVVKGYHCPQMLQRHMNTVYIDRKVNDEIIYEMIDHSYEEVIKTFSKKNQEKINKSNI